MPQFGVEEKREPENEVSLEERTRIRMKQIRRIVSRLEKLEAKYRLAKGNYQRGKAKGSRDLNRIKNNREAIFHVAPAD